MEKNNNRCYKCGETNNRSNLALHGYTICEECISDLRLFQDKTIKKHYYNYLKLKENDPDHPSFVEEMDNRLIYLEKDYISKRIKLLHIKDRLRYISKS